MKRANEEKEKREEDLKSIKIIKVENVESPESSRETSPEQEERPRRLRSAAAKTSEVSENSKRNRRSVTSSLFDGPFEQCVLSFGDNCKKTIKGGHRISTTEGCCSSCFARIFRGKDYENGFNEWKRKALDGQWISRSDQYVKRYINSKFLPFYKKCQKCGKYEVVHTSDNLTADDFSNFVCVEGCDKTIEWAGINEIRKDSTWNLKNSGYPPLLQNNIAFSLLVVNYVTRSTGMDATCQENAKLVENGGVPFRDTRKIMNMFYVPYTDVIANIVHPEFMEADEKLAFPKLAADTSSIYYLQVRNTIIAMWLKHPFAHITPKMVEAQIIVRGHARIFLIEHLVEPILTFLTIKGVVNYGAIDFRITPVKKTDLRVAIIGAGISGISAARHLKHLGIDSVVLFEAKDRYGGRINDDKSLGVAVGKGAQIIVGNINNPITLLCEQIGIKYRNSNFYCPLVDEASGKCFTKEEKQLDDQVDLHYNNVLDAIRNKFSLDKGISDKSLEEMFQHISQNLLEAAGLEYLCTKDFKKLLDFHLGNLEFSCGTKVAELSAKEYDHNEKFGNFAGEHAVITDGAQTIIEHLAKELDIRLNSVVKQIDWRDNNIFIYFEDNRRPVQVDKVIVTTSLAVLKKNPKLFHPPLPDWKRKAINDLGAGLIEKVAVRFDNRFWSSTDDGDKKTEYFGKVAINKEDRSLFNIFYDFSAKGEDGIDYFVLMSYVTAEHVNLVNELSDEEIALKFVEVLRKMFPKGKINPLGQMVSHWGSDPFIGMSYTFVPFGSPGDETYNQLKQTVDNKLYFAGEHTIASEPQTMTGAFMSGLREAGKIVLSIDHNFKQEKKRK